MNGWDVPTLTVCSLCERKIGQMPGPRARHGRPAPPAGRRLGYEVEIIDRFGAERLYGICAECLASVLQPAV